VSWAQPQTDPVTQTGVPALAAHTVALVPEHCVHSPASGPPCGWHAGSAGLGHAPDAGVGL